MADSINRKVRVKWFNSALYTLSHSLSSVVVSNDAFMSWLVQLIPQGSNNVMCFYCRKLIQQSMSDLLHFRLGNKAL